MTGVNACIPGPDASAENVRGHQFGVLPWRWGRGGKIKILLITSRQRGRWIMPKGWLMAGCSPAESAAHEAFEEAGVIGHVHADAIGCYLHTKVHADTSTEVRHVTMFSLYVQGTLTSWPEMKQRRRKWFSLADARLLIAEAGLVALIDKLNRWHEFVPDDVRRGAM